MVSGGWGARARISPYPKWDCFKFNYNISRLHLRGARHTHTHAHTHARTDARDSTGSCPSCPCSILSFLVHSHSDFLSFSLLWFIVRFLLVFPILNSEKQVMNDWGKRCAIGRLEGHSFDDVHPQGPRFLFRCLRAQKSGILYAYKIQLLLNYASSSSSSSVILPFVSRFLLLSVSSSPNVIQHAI